ncbi:MAG: hypothetical protein ACRDBO_12125 [Lachnospiraceae bacterium]
MGVDNMKCDSITKLVYEIREVLDREPLKSTRSVKLIIEESFFNYDNARRAFKIALQISPHKYIKRRRLLAVYRSINDYETLSKRSAVGNILSFKKKFSEEFKDEESIVAFDQLFDEQQMIENIESAFIAGSFRLIEKDMLWNRKEVVVAEEVEYLVLLDAENRFCYDYDNTYFSYRGYKFVLTMSRMVAPFQEQTVWLDFFGGEICVISGRTDSDPTLLKWIKQHFEKGQAAIDMQVNFSVHYFGNGITGARNLFDCISGRDNIVTDIKFSQGLITVIDGTVRLQVSKLFD